MMNDLVMSLMPFAPILVVMATTMVVMISIAIKRSHFVTATLSVVGLNLGLLVLLAQMLGLLGMGGEQTSTMFVVDNFAQFNMAVIFISVLACCTLAYGYFEGFRDKKDELYLLMLLSTIGSLLMTSAQHLASFFVSLELLSVPLYGMLAYSFTRSQSLESGLKYLVLSATASATLLMGMAFIYAQLGTLQFVAISQVLERALNSPLVVLGSAMMMFGIAFKLSAAPFHAWTPDVYEGSSAPVSTFLASVSKVAMMALVIRFLTMSAILTMESMQLLVTVIAVLSIFAGNLLAVYQNNLKRLLGYSSIAHMGYVLAIIASIGPASDSTTNMYMAMYALTSIGAFGVIALMSSPYREVGEASDLSHYQGLFWRRPVLTAVMVIMLLSLAGIPLTAGFVTKYFAVLATVQGHKWLLSLMIIIGSAIGLFYYLRVLLTLFKRPLDEIQYDASKQWGIKAGGTMVILVTLLVLYFGIFPNNLIEWSALSRVW